MNVLVTGAAGFIGSHLCERLHADGNTVVGVDNLTTGREANVPDGVDLHVEDIRDRDVLYGIANATKPDLIVHCAASYSNPNYWHRDTDTNTTGSINVAIVAKHHGVRVVYFQTALPPTSSYAISKHAGEHYLTLSGVPLTVFRLANMYGPRNLSGPIPTFYRRITAGATIFAPRATPDRAASGNSHQNGHPRPCLPDPSAVATAFESEGASTIAAGTRPQASPGTPTHGKGQPLVVDGAPAERGGTPAATTDHNEAPAAHLARERGRGQEDS